MCPRFAAGLSVICSLALSHLAVGAEPFNLTIPGQGWFIAFESPSLSNFVGQTNGKSSQFRAIGETGFNVTIYVEEPKGKSESHESCFNYYWPLAKRNPTIDQPSVKVMKTDRFVKVSYVSKVAEGNKETATSNVNYYFRFKGRWVDVHVSRYPPRKDDDEVLAAFEKSISYRTSKSESKSP